jgi:hypothetical protein
MKHIKIFRSLDDLNCFVVDTRYQRTANQIGLAEWSLVVWIGRLFTLDNDYGEHWFDNWLGRELFECDPLDTVTSRLGVSLRHTGLPSPSPPHKIPITILIHPS